jgi:predicted alpha/beta-hydrolase family hydrolase
LDIETPSGPARAHLRPAARPRALLVLGHGAGGGVAAPDLVAAADVAVSVGASVALVEQPYRVAGRRSPPRAPQLDAAWTAVVARLSRELSGLPIVTGGRSSGARVACRTAEATGAVGLLCLAFPLQPAARASGAQAPSRLPELDALKVPTLVVQGVRDPFGMPPSRPDRTVVAIAGDHGLKSDMPALRDAVRAWMVSTLDALGPPADRPVSTPRPGPVGTGGEAGWCRLPPLAGM